MAADWAAAVVVYGCSAPCKMHYGNMWFWVFYWKAWTLPGADVPVSYFEKKWHDPRHSPLAMGGKIVSLIVSTFEKLDGPEAA